MTHREFLVWLKPQLEKAVATGLSADTVRAIVGELEYMRGVGALQPFASRLESLLRGHATPDEGAVKAILTELRSELAPPREQTVVLSAAVGPHEKPPG